jgi:hypothetical protein
MVKSPPTGPLGAKRSRGVRSIHPQKGVSIMPSGKKKEERDDLLRKVVRLAPLFALGLQAIDLLLRLFGVLK